MKDLLQTLCSSITNLKYNLKFVNATEGYFLIFFFFFG